MASAKKVNKEKNLSTHQSLNKHLLWPDAIRIIAIYFVVQVHTTLTSINSFSASTFFSKFDVMGVPLFILLSGALLLGKQEDYKTFFRKRCIKVLFPWIVWTLLYMGYFYTVHHNQIQSEFFKDNSSILSAWFRFFFRMFMSNLWFLPMIFSIYLLTPILRILVKYATNFDNLYVLTLWFIFISVLPFVVKSPLFPLWEPTFVFIPTQYSGYFLLGYIAIKQELFKKLTIPILFVISLLPFLFTLIPIRSAYIQSFTGGYLLPGTIIASLFFFYFLYSICNKIDSSINFRVRRVITVVGKASFGIYIINEMFIDYFGVNLMRILNVVHLGSLITLVSFSLIAAIVVILQQIPIINYILP